MSKNFQLRQEFSLMSEKSRWLQEIDTTSEPVESGEGHVLVSEIRSDPASIVSAICLSVMVILSCVLILQALAWWRVSKRSTLCVKLILLLSIFIMVTVVVFSFVGNLNLKLLFSMSLIAQYLGLCSLTILLQYLRHNTAHKMRRKVRWLLLPMHVLYAVVFIIGLTDDLGASCSSSMAFPVIFYLKDACFVLYFALLLTLNYKKFLIDWNNAGQNQLKQKDLENQKKSEQQGSGTAQKSVRNSVVGKATLSPMSAVRSGGGNVSLSPRGLVKEEQTLFSVEEKVFKFQTSRLIQYSTFCLFLNLMAILVVTMLTSSSNHIGCSSKEENTLTFYGASTAIFVDFLLRLAIICAAFLPRFIFVKTVKQVEQGWQETIKCIRNDYRKGLTLKPQTFSDDEANGEDVIQNSTKILSNLKTKNAEISKDKDDFWRAHSVGNGKTNAAGVVVAGKRQQLGIYQQQQQILDTQVGGDAEEEQAIAVNELLDTERCETEEGLLFKDEKQPSKLINTTNKVKQLRNVINHLDKQTYPDIQIVEEEPKQRQKDGAPKNEEIELPSYSMRKIELNKNKNITDSQGQGGDPRKSSLQNGSEKLTPKSDAEKNESVVRFAAGPPQILGQNDKYEDVSSDAKMNFVDNNYDEKMAAGQGRKKTNLKSPIFTKDQQDQQKISSRIEIELVTSTVAPISSTVKQSLPVTVETVEHQQNQQQATQAPQFNTDKNDGIDNNSKSDQKSDEKIKESDDFNHNQKHHHKRPSLLVSSLTILPNPTEQDQQQQQQYLPFDHHEQVLLNEESLAAENDRVNKTEQPLLSTVKRFSALQVDPQYKPLNGGHETDRHMFERQEEGRRMTFGPSESREIIQQYTPKQQSENQIGQNRDDKEMSFSQPTVKENDYQRQQNNNRLLQDDPFQQQQVSDIDSGSDWLNDDLTSNNTYSQRQQQRPSDLASLKSNPMEELKSSKQESALLQLVTKINSQKMTKNLTENRLSNRLNQNDESSTGQLPISPINKDTIVTAFEQTSDSQATSMFHNQSQKNDDVMLPRSQNADQKRQKRAKPIIIIDQTTPSSNSGALTFDDKKDNKQGPAPTSSQQLVDVDVFVEQMQEVQIEEQKQQFDITPTTKDVNLKHNDNLKSSHSETSIDSLERPTIAVVKLGQISKYKSEQPEIQRGGQQQNNNVPQFSNIRHRTEINVLKPNRENKSKFKGVGSFREPNNNFTQNRNNSISSVSDIFDGKYQPPGFIQGPGQANPNSFISNVPENMQALWQRQNTDERVNENQQNQHQAQVGQQMMQQQQNRFGGHSNKKVKKKRIVRSNLQAKVVSLNIVPRVTKYQQRERQAKLDEKIRLVKAQHRAQGKGVTLQDELQATLQTYTARMAHESAKKKKGQTNTNSIRHIDLRKNGQPTERDLKAPKGLHSASAIMQSDQTKNRFVKNILKKANSSDQVKHKKKKSVTFQIGTGTRGQAHREENADIYLQQDNRLQAIQEIKLQADENDTGKSSEIYTDDQIQRMQMAMPGVKNPQAELYRQIQDGPPVGGDDLTRQLILLEKQQKFRALHIKPQAVPKVIEAPKIPAGVKNPYDEHKKAAEAIISASDIYLETSPEKGMQLQNPYEFQYLGTSPSPQK